MTARPDLSPRANDAIRLAGSLHDVVERYLRRRNSDPDVVNTALSMLVGDWVHCCCLARGLDDETPAIVEMMGVIASYLAAREEDREHARTATKH